MCRHARQRGTARPRCPCAARTSRAASECPKTGCSRPPVRHQHGRPATTMPSSTNWHSDWLLPLSTLSLLRASATVGRTIQFVGVKSAAYAAQGADTKASRLVSEARVSTVVYSTISDYNLSVSPHPKQLLDSEGLNE